MGDRPLRSPTHRRLGGPSPRLLSNGTHARPAPHRCFRPGRMPSLGRMGHHPAFPPAVPPSGVGCIRVTHPSATLNPPKGILPFDLHVLGLPLAFILSQDQTLHCIIAVLSFFSCFRAPLCFFAVPYSRNGPSLPAPRLGLMLASSFQRTSDLPASPPLFRVVENGCKGTTFSLTRKLFFTFFSKIFLKADCQ